uniref:Phloem protein 2-14 n=1 Tax=Boehmeria nivea TaxID=83906 RepID=A0A2Z3EVV4_BOENI|nr:phloem protein 2-14 [Boehmeria nivea]
MDLQLVKKGFDFGRKKKKWVFLLAALGFTGYGAYRVYNLPSVAKKRRKILKLLGALVSVAEAVSDSAASIGIVSKDLREFLQSDSDQIPNSLRQLSKIAVSDELSSSLIRLTQGLTMGVLRGYQLAKEKGEGGGEAAANSGFPERVLDRVFSPAGSGFASVVVGSFARNLVLGLYSASSQCQAIGEPNSKSASNAGGFASEKTGIPEWMDVVFSDKSRDLIGGCIQVFVSTAVAVYLEKTMEVNTYEELFAGLTNPKHETKVKDMFVSVCNGAVETFVRTSHQVLTGPSLKEDLFKPDSGPCVTIIEESKDPETDNSDQESESQSDNEENTSARSSSRSGGSGSGWVSKVSSTLAVPSNRRLVLDVTGRVTFETVRSFLEFMLEKLYEGARSCANAVYEAAVESGLSIMRYVAAKSSVIATICLSLCLHASGSSAWLLMPA